MKLSNVFLPSSSIFDLTKKEKQRRKLNRNRLRNKKEEHFKTYGTVLISLSCRWMKWVFGRQVGSHSFSFFIPSNSFLCSIPVVLSCSFPCVISIDSYYYGTHLDWTNFAIDARRLFSFLLFCLILFLYSFFYFSLFLFFLKTYSI